jgi:hypothetical protein
LLHTDRDTTKTEVITISSFGHCEPSHNLSHEHCRINDLLLNPSQSSDIPFLDSTDSHALLSSTLIAAVLLHQAQ